MIPFMRCSSAEPLLLRVNSSSTISLCSEASESSAHMFMRQVSPSWLQLVPLQCTDHRRRSYLQIQPGTIKDHHSMNEQPAVSELEVLSLLASSKLNFQNKSSEGCPPGIPTQQIKQMKRR